MDWQEENGWGNNYLRYITTVTIFNKKVAVARENYPNINNYVVNISMNVLCVSLLTTVNFNWYSLSVFSSRHVYEIDEFYN